MLDGSDIDDLLPLLPETPDSRCSYLATRPPRVDAGRFRESTVSTYSRHELEVARSETRSLCVGDLTSDTDSTDSI